MSIGSEPRVSTCRIERGLYLLRYVDSPSEPYPLAQLNVVQGQIELMPAPGREIGVLSRPGQVMALVAQGSGIFEIRVSTRHHGDHADANFALELLDGGVETHGSKRVESAEPSQRDRRPDDRAVSAPLAILAHVARRGDVKIAAGEWISGPREVLPIEGLTISTMRHDICVELRVQTARGGGQWSKWHRDGEFAGTRQRAEALTGIQLRLYGDRLWDFSLCAEVMALGASVRRYEGREIEFAGFDPIVGFRIELKDATGGGSVDSAQSESRLRVFRAKN